MVDEIPTPQRDEVHGADPDHAADRTRRRAARLQLPGRRDPRAIRHPARYRRAVTRCAAQSGKTFTAQTAPVRLRGDQPVMTTKGWDMIRVLLAAAAIAGAAVSTAPAAAADNGDNM